jgi:hypothetical protein
MPVTLNQKLFTMAATVGALALLSERSKGAVIVVEPKVTLTPDRLNVASIEGYRRATDAEVNSAPTLKAEVSKYLSGTVGQVFFREYDGKQWAIAVETHTNHPEIGPTNKGISVFILNGDTTGITDSESFRRNTQLLVFIGIAYFGYKVLA